MVSIEDFSALEKECIRRKVPLLGAEKGQVLLSLVERYRPLRILEIGSAFGYSGCILGSFGGRLVTIEQNPRLLEQLEETFASFGVDARVIIGDGVGVVNELCLSGEAFDFIFVDFAKKLYPQVYEACVGMLEKGGVLVIDDIFMAKAGDFSQTVLDDKRFFVEFVHIGNGMSIGVKKKE